MNYYKLGAFIRKFLLALGVLLLLNSLRLSQLDQLQISYGQLFTLVFMFIATYFIHPKTLSILFLLFGTVALYVGHLMLGIAAYAGIFIPIAALLMSYYFALKLVFSVLALAAISLVVAFQLLLSPQYSIHDISFFQLRSLGIFTSAGFAAVFFDTFAHLFDDSIQRAQTSCGF